MGDKFDVVAFDPPYISIGGRATSTIDDFNDGYGLLEAMRTPVDLHLYNINGLEQASVVAAPGGLILVKCMAYVSSGALQPVPMWIFEYATTEMGLKLEDWIVHKGEPGPQPLTDKCPRCKGTGEVPFGSIDPEVLCPEVPVDCPVCERAGKVPRRQVHARQNAPHLFIFKTPAGSAARRRDQPHEQRCERRRPGDGGAPVHPGYIAERGYPPSRREVAEHGSYTPSTAQRIIEQLRDRGLIRVVDKIPAAPRSPSPG